MDVKNLIAVLILLSGCLADDKIAKPVIIDQNHNFLMNATKVLKISTVPHMVALTVGPVMQAIFCGGSLISRKTVLTAAHCIDAVYIDGALASTLSVVVGTLVWNSGGDSYSIDRNISHPHFNKSTLKNDIGLLITKTEVDLTLNVRLVRLTFDFIPGGIEAKVTGWGKLGKNEPASDVLQELQVPIISAEECEERFIPFRNDTRQKKRPIPPIDPVTQICTFYSKGTGFCKGDSGSPLTRLSDYNQIGVVSWGILCGRGAPDVYIRISGYKDWLQTNIV